MDDEDALAVSAISAHLAHSIRGLPPPPPPPTVPVRPRSAGDGVDAAVLASSGGPARQYVLRLTPISLTLTSPPPFCTDTSQWRPPVVVALAGGAMQESRPSRWAENGTAWWPLPDGDAAPSASGSSGLTPAASVAAATGAGLLMPLPPAGPGGGYTVNVLVAQRRAGVAPPRRAPTPADYSDDSPDVCVLGKQSVSLPNAAALRQQMLSSAPVELSLLARRSKTAPWLPVGTVSVALAVLERVADALIGPDLNRSVLRAAAAAAVGMPGAGGGGVKETMLVEDVDGDIGVGGAEAAARNPLAAAAKARHL